MNQCCGAGKNLDGSGSGSGKVLRLRLASLRSGKSGTSQLEESYMGAKLWVMSSIKHWAVKPCIRCKLHSVKIWLVELSLNDRSNIMGELRCSTVIL